MADSKFLRRHCSRRQTMATNREFRKAIYSVVDMAQDKFLSRMKVEPSNHYPSSISILTPRKKLLQLWCTVVRRVRLFHPCTETDVEDDGEADLYCEPAG